MEPSVQHRLRPKTTAPRDAQLCGGRLTCDAQGGIVLPGTALPLWTNRSIARRSPGTTVEP
jgi:hypothetical protein